MVGRTNAIQAPGTVSNVACAVEISTSNPPDAAITYHLLKDAYDISEPVAVGTYGSSYVLYLLPESGRWTVEQRFYDSYVMKSQSIELPSSGTVRSVSM